MITINGKQYAKNNKQVVDSLFNPGGTVSGTYKVMARSILLHDITGKLFAAIVKPSANAYFVTAITVNGSTRYMQSTDSVVEERLGITGYRQGMETAASVWGKLK